MIVKLDGQNFEPITISITFEKEIEARAFCILLSSTVIGDELEKWHFSTHLILKYFKRNFSEQDFDNFWNPIKRMFDALKKRDERNKREKD